jgi:DoxX
VLIGLPFAMSGLGKLAAYGPTTAMIAAVGLPLPPLAFVVAVALELGGGLLLITDCLVRSVALALAERSVTFRSNGPNRTLLALGELRHQPARLPPKTCMGRGQGSWL